MELKGWHDWIEKKYLSWRGNGRGSVSEFSVWLGVSQPTVSAWLNKSRGAPATQKIIDAVARRYPDVYDVLDIEITSPVYERLFDDWKDMSPKAKREILLIWKKDLEERNDAAGLQVLETLISESQI